MLKKGDRVQFIDSKIGRMFPSFYPSLFSKGTIIEVGDDSSAMKYLVRWDNSKTRDWYYTDTEIRKAW